MTVKFGLNDWRQYHPREEPDAPIVLCFGDSWIWYPIPGSENLPIRFNDFGKWQAIDFCCLGENGLEFTNIDRSILGDVETFLRWEAKTIDMIILSGGGNDVSGPDDLPSLIKDADQVKVVDRVSPASWINEKNLSARVTEIESTIRRVIHLRDTFCNPELVPILAHAYAYAHSSGRGLLSFSPWIQPTLNQKGVPQEAQDGVVRIIIDKLADLHKSIAKDPSVKGYQFIDARDVLAESDWANELHPTRTGFQKIAAQFFPTFQSRFSKWVKEPRWVSEIVRSNREVVVSATDDDVDKSTGTGG